MRTDKELIISILTLRVIGDYKVKDASESMRINMLCMELADGNHTLDSIKETIGFKTFSSNFNIQDNYLKELINQVTGLEKLKTLV